MSSWLIGLAVFFTVVFIILFLNIFINIKYLKTTGNHSMHVSILIFRRLRLYTFKISPADFIKVLDKPNTAPQKTEEPTPDFENTDGKSNLKPHYNFMGKVLKSTYFEKLHFKMVYGFEDAALTGMSAGILSALKETFSVLFKNYFKIIHQPNLCIIPVYGHNRLEVEFNCILRIRLGNVIKIIAGAYTH